MDSPPPPDTLNLFGSLTTTSPPERVARLFAYRGWQVRPCAGTEYEIACEIAELVLKFPCDGKPGTLLLRGAVADVIANLPRIVEPIARAEIPYSFECYNSTFDLIHLASG